MKNFRSSIKKSQKMAWNTEHSIIDYSMINDAEYEAEKATREYASDKCYDGCFDIWEDGIVNAHNLTSNQVDELESVYLKAYKNFLEQEINP